MQTIYKILINALIMYIKGLLMNVMVLHICVQCTPYTSDCNEKLLENKELVPDSAFSESSYEENFKGKYARDSSNEDQAWCPMKKVGTSLKEFVSIDIGKLCVVKMFMTRGRNAVGYVSAQSYFIKYKHENESEWKFYRNYSESKELIGRKDPLNENFISLDPPLIARWLRIYPFHPTNEKICLKLQLYGCANTNHVVEYQMLDGSQYLRGLNSNKFKDITYDGRSADNGMLLGGIGKLVDRDIEGNSELTPIVDDAKKFVGWDNDQLKKEFVTIVFRFDSVRNFSMISLRAANHFAYNIRVFKSIIMTFGWNYNGLDIVAQTGKQSMEIQSDDRMMMNRWIEIDIKGQIGNFVRVDLYFGSQWLILSEINFQSEFLQVTKDLFQNQIITDYPSTFNSRNHINSEKEKWDNSTILPLTHTLGLICGILGVIIIMGSLFLIYLHNKRKRNTPLKKRVVQLKFPEDENLFLGNDNQFYTTELKKGTLIPFNISPYKYYTTQKNPNDLSTYHQNLLTPNHNITNFPSPNVIIKSSPNHNNHGIDSCIYTSLPASDTESLGTPDHNPSNSHKFISKKFQSSPATPYWSSRSLKKLEPLEKVYFNSNALEDINNFTFQCYPDNVPMIGINNMGLIYTNKDHSQEYDHYKTNTLNDTDDDTGSFYYYGSADFNLSYKDTMMGCCGNSTMMSSTKNIITNAKYLGSPFKLTNVDDLVPLGSGRWGDLFIDISFPNNFGFHLDVDGGAINQNYGTKENENKAVLVKILDDNTPKEIKERFRQEYSVLSLIDHEGLSRILSVNFDLKANHQIIISEYSLHGNLHSYFQNMYCSSKFKFFDSTLNLEGQNIFKNPQGTMSIILQLAQALNYLEGVQLIHRDVSCRNCLIYHMTDRDLKIKLVDSAMSQTQYRSFYFRPRAILQASPITSFHSTSVSATLLPLRWSAYETITDSIFSIKSDVYAFGITLWEIYNRCRTYPLSEITEEEIVLNSLGFNLNNIEQCSSLSLPPSCAKEISDFFKQCIHPNPNCRPNFQDICTFIQNKVSKTS